MIYIFKVSILPFNCYSRRAGKDVSIWFFGLVWGGVGWVRYPQLRRWLSAVSGGEIPRNIGRLEVTLDAS